MRPWNVVSRLALPFLLTGLAGVGLGRPAAAQTAGPRDVASRFLDAIAAERWTEAAQMLDLDAFREYVQHFTSRSDRSSTTRPIPTVEDLRRQDPSMPREVAEWHVRQMREAQSRMGDPTEYEFAGVRSIAALRRLPIEEAAARWLEARSPQYSLRRQLEEMRCPVPDARDLPVPERRLLGVITESDTVSYALHREELEFGGPPAGGEFGVIELKLRRGRWVVEPRGDLLPELSLSLEPGECPGGRN